MAGRSGSFLFFSDGHRISTSHGRTRTGYHVACVSNLSKAKQKFWETGLTKWSEPRGLEESRCAHLPSVLPEKWSCGNVGKPRLASLRLGGSSGSADKLVERCKRRDQLQLVTLHMSDTAVENWQNLDVVLGNYRTTKHQKDEKVDVWKSNCCCFHQKRGRLEEGWRILRTAADYERDYLLPAPSSNCNGFLHAELRCDSAFAMKNHVLYSLQTERSSVFPRVSTTFWTPHSARAFMSSSTEALEVPKEERGYLGGWSARGSDTYTRVAVRVISNFQRLVIRALIERPNFDPLAEEETIIQFETFL